MLFQAGDLHGIHRHVTSGSRSQSFTSNRIAPEGTGHLILAGTLAGRARAHPSDQARQTRPTH